MALEIRPNCEYCDKGSAGGSPEARICSYECTSAPPASRPSCAAFARTAAAVSPRPIRPATEWRPGVSLTKRPASSKRVHLSYDFDDIAALMARIAGIAPEDR
jgi:hypothetical protein